MVVVILLFIIALLFTPIVAIVPIFAAAPALVIVGVFMFKVIIQLDLSDIKIAFPSFVTIILMPLTYSISVGLSFGFITYILIHAFSKEYHKIPFTLWSIGILSIINLILL